MIPDWALILFWSFWAGLGAVGWWAESDHRLRDWLDSDEEVTPIEEVHQQYLDSEIDERELERRLEVLVDDRAATICDMADDVDGIGEQLSRDLAREFDSVADLQGADTEDLQRVDGIGETRAERLRDDLG